MSQWTHVNASIRYDTHIGIGLPDFGYNVPEGSEGPLTISIWQNPHRMMSASHTVSIFGDLRDYNDVEEILRYFTRITTENYDSMDSKLDVRSGTLEIIRDWIDTKLFRWDSEVNEWIQYIPLES